MRCHDPDDFWRGFQLRLFDADGQIVSQVKVGNSLRRDGCLHLASPLPETPWVGQPYELVSDFDAPILAIRWLLGLTPDQSLPPVRVRLGTTRGTNALLTRQGAATALITTEGFGDILLIGNQERPQLFELNIQKPTSLFSHVIEVTERISSTGTIEQPLNVDHVLQQLHELRRMEIR